MSTEAEFLRDLAQALANDEYDVESTPARLLAIADVLDNLVAMHTPRATMYKGIDYCNGCRMSVRTGEECPTAQALRVPA